MLVTVEDAGSKHGTLSNCCFFKAIDRVLEKVYDDAPSAFDL
jgi:hypothetical protein